MWKCFLGIHDFSKWSDPKPFSYFVQDASKEGVGLKQERTCKICNIHERRDIVYGS